MAKDARVAQGVVSSDGSQEVTGAWTKLIKAASAAACLASCFDDPYPLYVLQSTYSNKLKLKDQTIPPLN